MPTRPDDPRDFPAFQNDVLRQLRELQRQVLRLPDGSDPLQTFEDGNLLGDTQFLDFGAGVTATKIGDDYVKVTAAATAPPSMAILQISTPQTLTGGDWIKPNYATGVQGLWNEEFLWSSGTPTRLKYVGTETKWIWVSGILHTFTTQLPQDGEIRIRLLKDGSSGWSTVGPVVTYPIPTATANHNTWIVGLPFPPYPFPADPNDYFEFEVMQINFADDFDIDMEEFELRAVTIGVATQTL